MSSLASATTSANARFPRAEPAGRRRILAVVVTYNRCELLARCVRALRGQTRPPEEIVVVNNGSTDDTEAMLREQGVRLITQENVGSAGGWHRGIRCALEEGFDAVWLMDDDGYPEESALQQLDAALTPGTACVSCAVVCEDNHERLVFPLPRLNARGLPLLFAARRKCATLGEAAAESGGALYPFAHFFNGALIAAPALRAIGNVDREFFIFGEELDYLYRLRHGGAVHTLLTARQIHPDVAGRPLTDMKIYYYIKNTLILNRRYFDWVPLRNLLTIAAALMRTGRRNGWGEAWAYVGGRKRALLRRAISHGLAGRLGKEFCE
jgi:GT2 family glycosyltransferase